jgi:TIR domain-containing protein
MVASTPVAPGRIFISYRRQETAYPAGWLYERVAAHFGREQVFKDVDSIVLGDDFAEVIANAVGSCDVLLALIGDRWLTVTNEDGRRRLDDPDDFVRLEIETALKRKIRIIPVLFEGARLPRAGELPASLARLVRRQALELSPSRFDADIAKLLRVLDATLAEEQARREQAAQAAREAEEQARREQAAQAAREAEEQARREAEERKLSTIDEVAQELRSENPAAVASAEGALRRLENDANQRVAQAAASVLANWREAKAQREAEAKAQREAEAKAQREAEAKATFVMVRSPVARKPARQANERAREKAAGKPARQADQRARQDPAAKPARQAEAEQTFVMVRRPSIDSTEGTNDFWNALAAGVFLVLVVLAVVFG